MTVDRVRIKRAAKVAIIRQKPNVFLITFIYMAITYVINYLVNRITDIPDAAYGMWDSFVQGQIPVMPEINFNIFGILLSIALEIMALILSVGFVQYCLNTSRHQQANGETLFDAFGFFFRVLWMYLLQYIFILLWSFLLLIPGIIASYRYRMAFYILLDHPELSVAECLRASKELMRGRKLELFILDLSFLGWAILTLIPFAGLGVFPYMETTYANFYNEISGFGYGDRYRDAGAEPEAPPSDHSPDSRPPWEY